VLNINGHSPHTDARARTHAPIHWRKNSISQTKLRSKLLFKWRGDLCTPSFQSKHPSRGDPCLDYISCSCVV